MIRTGNFLFVLISSLVHSLLAFPSDTYYIHTPDWLCTFDIWGVSPRSFFFLFFFPFVFRRLGRT